DVGIGHLRQRPRVRVHQVGLDTTVCERGRHLHAQRARLDHHGPLHGVEDLVPLHRVPDVLDVVETLQVATGDTRVGVVEAGREDERVVTDLPLAVDGHRAGAG